MNELAKKYAYNLRGLWKDTKSKLKEVINKMVKRKKKNLYNFKKGQLIYLNIRNLNRNKLNKRYNGPFRVKRNIKDLTYKLKFPK